MENENLSLLTNKFHGVSLTPYLKGDWSSKIWHYYMDGKILFEMGGNQEMGGINGSLSFF